VGPTDARDCGPTAQIDFDIPTLHATDDATTPEWPTSTLTHEDHRGAALRQINMLRCTTRRCLVSASFLLNDFPRCTADSCTFCLRALWIVSSCRVRSYGREKMVLHGLPVDGLILSHCVRLA